MINSRKSMGWARISAPLVLTLLVAGPVALNSASAQSGSAESDHHLLLAELAIQDGAVETAIREYLLASGKSDDPERAKQAMQVAYQHGYYRQSLEAAKRWQKLDSDNPTTGLSIAQLYLLLDDSGKARKAFAKLVEQQEEERGPFFLELAGMFLDTDAPWLASGVMEKLAGPYPDLAQAHYANAAVAMSASRFELAREASSKAIEKDPEWLAAKTIAARAQIASGDIDGGLSSAEDVVIDSRDLVTRLEFAYMLMSVGRLDEARVELMLLIEDHGSTGALRALGFLELDEGRFEESEQVFSQLLRSGEYTYDALFYLGLIAEKMEDFPRAMKAYAEVTIGNNAVAAQARIAYLMNKMGDAEIGLNHLEEFGAANPHYRLDMMVARAELLAQIGRYDESKVLYDEVLTLRPGDESTGFAKAFMLDRAGQTSDSIKLLRTFVRRRGDDPLALNALGYTMVDRSEKIKEAGKYIDKALALAPVNSAIIDSKGWFFYRSGDNARAIEYLTRAYSLDNDPEIAAHLGEVYWESGDEVEAQKVWFNALARNPDSDALMDTMERYGQ